MGILHSHDPFSQQSATSFNPPRRRALWLSVLISTIINSSFFLLFLPNFVTVLRQETRGTCTYVTIIKPQSTSSSRQGANKNHQKIHINKPQTLKLRKAPNHMVYRHPVKVGQVPIPKPRNHQKPYHKALSSNNYYSSLTQHYPINPHPTKTYKPLRLSGTNGLHHERHCGENIVNINLLKSIFEWIAKHKYYPVEAIFKEEQGSVLLKLTITTTGNITKVRIEHPSHYESLNRAALKMLKLSSPIPLRLLKGIKLPARAQLKINYIIKQ